MATSWDSKLFSVKRNANTNTVIGAAYFPASGYLDTQRLVNRDIKTGTSNPSRFSFFLANGYLPVAPYVRVRDKVESFTQGSLTSTWGPVVNGISIPPGGDKAVATTDFRVWQFCDLLGSLYTPVTDATFVSLRAKAIAKCNGNVRENAGMFETFAELRKTQKMFLSAARTIISAARHVRRGRFVEAARDFGVPLPGRAKRSRSFASNWLEYRYGWTPLYSSLFTAAKVTYDYYRNREFIRYAYGAADAQLSWVGTTNFSASSTDYPLGTGFTYGEYVSSPFGFSAYRPFNWGVERSYDRTLKVNVGYIFKISNPNLSYVNEMGLADPLSIAWELVPLSFVADWFVNVGDVLEQVGTFTGKTFLSGFITYQEWVTGNIRSVRLADTPTQGITLSGYQPASIRRKLHRIERQVLTSQPLFGFQSEIGLNNKRLADAVSLIRQALR